MSTPATRRTPDAIMVKLRAWHLDRFGPPVDPQSHAAAANAQPLGRFTGVRRSDRVLASQQRERTAVDGLSGHSNTEGAA